MNTEELQLVTTMLQSMTDDAVLAFILYLCFGLTKSLIIGGCIIAVAFIASRVVLSCVAAVDGMKILRDELNTGSSGWLTPSEIRGVQIKVLAMAQEQKAKNEQT